MSKLPVLFLVGSGRSGTTLLSRLLDLQDGYRAVGETRYAGDAYSWPMVCGCGEPHEGCELWGPLISSWKAEPDRLAAWLRADYAAQLDQLAGFVAPGRLRPGVRSGLSELRHVYETLGSTGEIVVDESKTPWLGFLLAQQPWADVRFVELVRDPHEVITSWQNAKDYLEYTPREVAAKHWLRTCLTAEAMRKRTGAPWLRTSYRRLANAPLDVLEDITGGPVQRLTPVEGAVAFTSEPNHIYLSNPDKLRRGPDSVRPSRPKPADPPAKVGPWERASNRYWTSWLADRTELRSPGWAPSQRL